MTKLPTLSPLEKMKLQREKLDARIKLSENRVRTAESKRDLRRKILLGAYYLNKATEANKFDELKTLMDSFLTRPNDRELFGLPVPETQTETA